MIRPEAIRLEASSFCQLRCPSCPTTSGAIHPAVGSGFLKAEDFRRLLDRNPWVKQVELSNFGEIFLNPELLDIIREAWSRRVTLTAVNGVNLNNVREDVLEGLVRYRFFRMVCSIDGASEETYRRYRVRGKFQSVIRNIERINAHKAQYESPYPILRWQFIAFGHNEHEIPAARRMANELGMEFYVKLSWDESFSPVVDPDLVRSETKEQVASRREYARKYGRHYRQTICDQLWDRPQINWDGRLLGCCYNHWGDFGGNAFEDGLLDTINGEKIEYARGMVTGRNPPRDGVPCTTCDIYRYMRRSGHWVQRHATARPRPPVLPTEAGKPAPRPRRSV